MTAFTIPTYTCRPTSRMEYILLSYADEEAGEFIVIDNDEEEFATFGSAEEATDCMALIDQARAHALEADRRSSMVTVRRRYNFRKVEDIDVDVTAC